MKDKSALARETKNYIDAGVKATLSVKHLATVFKTDPADLDREFRRLTGTTIKHYVDKKCRETLEDRLKSGVWLGYSIGQELGFETDQAFYRWVKRVCGVPFRELKEDHITNSTSTRMGNQRTQSDGEKDPEEGKPQVRSNA